MVYDRIYLIVLGLLWIVANACQLRSQFSSHAFSIQEHYRGTSWNMSGQRPAVPEESMSRNVVEIEVRIAGSLPSSKLRECQVFFWHALRTISFFLLWERSSIALTSKPRIPSLDSRRKPKKKSLRWQRLALLGLSGVALGMVVAASERHTWRS